MLSENDSQMWKIGDRVRVIEDYSSPYGGTVSLKGIITGSVPVEFDTMSIDTPVITLDDGTELRGYECWWILIEGKN